MVIDPTLVLFQWYQLGSPLGEMMCSAHTPQSWSLLETGGSAVRPCSCSRSFLLTSSCSRLSISLTSFSSSVMRSSSLFLLRRLSNCYRCSSRFLIFLETSSRGSPDFSTDGSSSSSATSTESNTF